MEAYHLTEKFKEHYSKQKDVTLESNSNQQEKANNPDKSNYAIIKGSVNAYSFFS